MKYTVNMKTMASTFPLPKSVADKYLKLATHNQLKVLLYCFSNISNEIDSEVISKVIAIGKDDVEDALFFWANAGILNSETEQEKPEKAVVIKHELPTREEVIRRGMEDQNIMMLLREAQMKFGRNLKSNESSFLVSLYDDEGMKPAVILVLLQDAVNKGKCNLSYIRSTALRWLKADVVTVADAERVINASAREEVAWKMVERIFGIEHRKPSEKELATVNKWLNEWNLNEELIKTAYDNCVDTKSTFSFPYVAKILENWHEKGIKTKADVSAKQKGKQNYDGGGAYDLDLFNQMANKD